MKNLSFSFLAIGKTQESKEGSQGFSRYIGIASSHVLAVNPTKEKLDELMGYESKEEPVYVGEDERGKFANITFIVRTDPDTCNGVEITNRAMITLRPEAAYNQNGDKVQVIDQYGNFTWAGKDEAQSGGKIEHAQKLDKYRIACVGECALVDFLKNYLNVPDAYDYKNGVWVKKPEDKAAEGIFGLESISSYFKGDFKEVIEAIALQPNNKIKLLYGVKTKDDGSQLQAICTDPQMTLNNAVGSKGLAKLEQRLISAKEKGKYANVDYRIQELTEFSVEPTNLEKSPASSGSEEGTPKMFWDM